MSDNDHHSVPGHIVPFKTYITVFISLIILTVITVAVTRIDLGVLDIIFAMIIASIKAGLVALYFMHLKYENPLTWMYVVFPIFLLFILIGGVFLDNPLRVIP